MQIPGRRPAPPITDHAFAINPEAPAGCILDPVIITQARVGRGAPPFGRDALGPFDARDQVRLRDVLEGLQARVMVVIKDTPMIRQLYGSDRWTIAEAAKTYMWTIKSRNDRSATHLTITNY